MIPSSSVAKANKHSAGAAGSPASAGSKKFVYSFEEGDRSMRELLGGKGANLAEMTNIGIPVPPGFTITTEVCDLFLKHRDYPDGFAEELQKNFMRPI